jgi:hypothetical protein
MQTKRESLGLPPAQIPFFPNEIWCVNQTGDMMPKALSERDMRCIISDLIGVEETEPILEKMYKIEIGKAVQIYNDMAFDTMSWNERMLITRIVACAGLIDESNY